MTKVARDWALRFKRGVAQAMPQQFENKRRALKTKTDPPNLYY